MPTQTFFDLSEEKRNRILSAARKVFAFAPYEKVTIQSIIEAADIPRGSFYQYFTDKDDLYLYCQKETLKKTLRITYGENMDYFWNVLRSETPEKKEESSWFLATLEHMKREMSDDEYQFVMNSAAPSENITRSICSEMASIIYPYFQKHLGSGDITHSPEKQQLLAFQFSLGDLLISEYEGICGASHDEALHAIRMIYRGLVEVFRDKGSDKLADSLQTLSVLRCLSDAGLNLTCAVALNAPPTEGGESVIPSVRILRIPIQPDSLSGRIACDATLTTDSRHGADKDNYLRIELAGNQRGMCVLTASGIEYPLGEQVTIIGTTRKGEKLCVMENGEFLL